MKLHQTPEKLLLSDLLQSERGRYSRCCYDNIYRYSIQKDFGTKALQLELNIGSLYPKSSTPLLSVYIIIIVVFVVFTHMRVSPM